MQHLNARFGDENYPYPRRTQVANRKDKARLEDFEGTVCLCCRPYKWGNPYKIDNTQTRNEVIKRFFRRIFDQVPPLLPDMHELTGKLLTCHCSPQDCHCDVLAAFADTFGAAQLAGLAKYLPDYLLLQEAQPVLVHVKGDWILSIGDHLAQGTDLYSVIRSVLDDFLYPYIGHIIGDVSEGWRINAANITPQEWAVIDDAEGREWFVPSDREWLALRNLLGLFELRRGFSHKPNPTYRFPLGGEAAYTIIGGTAQIRLNLHGRRVLAAKRDKLSPYEHGKLLTMQQIEPFLTEAERELLSGD